MKIRIDSRTYMNTILTVIAVLLAAMAVDIYRVNILSPAHAQRVTTGFSTADSTAPMDITNIPQQTDPVLAQATQNIANANLEIATALRDLTIALTGVGDTIAASNRTPATAAAGVISPAAVGTIPAERPTIEVIP